MGTRTITKCIHLGEIPCFPSCISKFRPDKIFGVLFNPLPNDKILDWSKFKELADDKINVTEKVKLVLGRVENIVGKAENAGYQQFVLFLKCFQKASFLGSLKVGIVW